MLFIYEYLATFELQNSELFSPQGFKLKFKGKGQIPLFDKGKVIF